MLPQENSQRFIIVDDNNIDLYIAERIINSAFENAEVIKFTEAANSLEFLSQQEKHPPTTILLDIYMPEMDGFGFLEEFANLSETIRNNYKIVILTSSSNQLDISRAQSNPHVVHMTQKPFTQVSLLHLFKNQ